MPIIFLALAIVTEVSAVIYMDLSAHHGGALTYGLMFVLISVSYYFLSLAVRSIPIGTAYAAWEALGLALIVIVSVFLFGEKISAQEWIGLALAIVGIVMVNYGEVPH